jgi:hypothetical protein
MRAQMHARDGIRIEILRGDQLNHGFHDRIRLQDIIVDKNPSLTQPAAGNSRSTRFQSNGDTVDNDG